MIKKIVGSLSLLACVASVAQAAPFAFGITDGGNIYSVDIAAKQSSLLYTETTPASFVQPNALAYDAAGGNLYYRGASAGDLFRYSLGSGVRSSSLLSGTTLGAGTSNAAFYAGSYWAVRDGSDVLVRVSNLTGTPVVNTFDLNGAGSVSPSFGDIAITTGGILYGHTSNGVFFRTNISALANTSVTTGSGTGYTSDAVGNAASLQIAFNPDSSVLYGHNFAGTNANNRWYTVNHTGTGTALGDATAIPGWNDALAYRDIAGSAAVIPEAGSVWLLGVGGLLGAVGLVRGRRRGG